VVEIAPHRRSTHRSGELRVAPPATHGPAGAGERQRHREPNRVDCVRIVHKERNLLAHAPKHLHDEIKADFNDMMHAKAAAEVVAKRKAFLAKWKLRCRPVAASLEEAGERLFTFLRYPPEQWRSLRTTNAIERLHEEFKRRIKTQCLLPCAETAAMLFWALLASGQITMRRVDGWPTLDRSPGDLDLAA
jgi:putative transposase